MIEALRKLLIRELFVDLVGEQGRYFLELKEDDESAKLRKVTIAHVPAGTLCLKLDVMHPPKVKAEKSKKKGSRKDAFHEPFRKRCDYLIITSKKDGTLVFLFVELKSLKENKDVGKIFGQVVRQLKGGFCLTEYFLSLLRELGNDVSVPDYETRYALFYGANNRKSPTRPSKHSQNKKPEECCKLANLGRISLNQLIAD